MKLKRRAQEVPPKIRAFINSVTTTPHENIEEPLKCFVWEFDKGDFHHWVDLLNHFDSFFEKYIKSRKELQLEDDFLDSDSPFPKAAVLQILRVIRIILENCTNKHFHSSYEQHLSALLASTDVDVVEACLQTLAAFLKKTVGKFSIRDASLKSKLYTLAQGWGVKEEGLGLVACALENGCDPVACELGSSLHYEYYAVSESANRQQTEDCPQGLRIIHLPNIGSHPESDLQLLHSLISEHKVPSSLRFSLLTRLRYAKAFGSVASRQQYTCIRLYAFIVLVKASIDADDLVSFFNAEPEFINELLSLLSYEEAVPEKIRVLCLLSLVALCQDRSRQPSVLSAVTSGGHRGILSSLVQKAIDSVISGSSKWSVVFAEALLSLVTALVSSSTGCSAMREAGFIGTLLPLLKDTDPQHLHLVSTAVHILEAFMDYSNPAAALFRELGGLDDTIMRLKLEVTYVENGSKQQVDASDYSGSSPAVISYAASDLDNVQSLYSDALVSYHRRMLMKALLHAISLGTYAPGNSSSAYGSDESLLPQCLRIIFQRAKDFGGGVFSLAATVMSDLIHKDPTCFSVLEASGLPSAFLDAIMDGVVSSSEAVSCIPQCLDALCLNNNGLQAVKDRNALRCFMKIFTSRSYMRALTGDTPGSLSSGLDELLRHASSLREPGVEMLVEILHTISNIGSGIESSNFATELSTSVPMETDTGGTSSSSTPEEDTSKIISDQTLDPLPDASASASNIEAFLPVCVSNAACLLETVLQNAETCRIFVEKKGIEAVLQLLTLPLMPVSVSLGHNMRVAFKNFSLQHYGSLARGVCSFLREYSKSTGDLLVSTGGVPLARVDSAVQAKVLRNLSVLEGILCLCAFLLKGATALFSELCSGDADVLKELGRAYREVIWQKSLCEDSKVEEEKTIEEGSENTDAGPSNPVGRESDDDANIPAVRYMNPVSLRSGSQSMWSGEREFFSVRSGESLHRRSRHGFSRIRGGRTGRHLEVFNLEIEAQSNAADLSSQSTKKKTPDVLVFEILGRLESSLRSFFTAIVKGFTSSNRRRGDSGSMGSASKALGSALAKIFLEGLTFTGHCSSGSLDMPLSVKCRYLGKIVDDMAAVTFDSRRHTCYAAMINNFYVHGTFKELLTTFEATSQLLWTPPYPAPTVGTEHEKVVEETKLSHSTWLRDTLQSYRRELEYFVNAGYLLLPTSTSHSSQAQAAQLLVQPVTTGLSIGLFPVPRDPDVFVQMLQSQVLDVILPVWNHQMFPSCNPDFVASIVSLVTHIYSGVGDVKRSRTGITGSSNQHYNMPPPPLDEATISTIVEMGFTRARAEEAIRRVETNSVEMAMEWLFTHPEDPVQEDDELARALALSLGSSSEAPKPDTTDKSMDIAEDVNQKKAPPVDDILSSLVKLFQNSDVLSFPLTDLLVTLCNRSKGEDRSKVIAFLIQQLKMCKLDFSSESGALGMILHVIALVLSEDGGTREIAAQNGIVSIAIDILMNFKASNELVLEVMVPKCISALLLILDNMVQPRPRVHSANSEGIVRGSLPDSSPEQASIAVPLSNPDKDAVPEVSVNESGAALEKIFGNPTGYLTIEEVHKLLQVACDFIKQQVPSLVMQAVLLLCARLTKTYDLAVEFLERGALTALFSLPRACFFPGYDTVASAIIKHLIEDPQTLQTAMELEIRQTLSGSRHAGRITPPLSFLTAMAPVISRDPAVFMRAAASICQLESSGGRTYVVLVKEKDKSKALGTEVGLVLNESGKLPESKMHDGLVKCSKGHRKVPANLAQVIDQLLDIVVKFPSSKSQDSCAGDLILMDVDESAGKVKGKSKVDAISRKTDPESERSAGLAKVTFILKLLSDILLMYVHAAGVILKRDLELSNQFDESANYGILHHILHNLVALSAEKFAGPDEWRQKLSEKASLFLVVLCGRSSEGRRRVVTELVKTFSTFANTTESNSSRTTLLPTKIIFSFAELTYSILSKNSSSSNLPSSGCSVDVAKSMIDGGMVQCLADVLQVIDLDHPDAPKTVNLIVKSLESLTRAANMSEQVIKSDVADKKKIGSDTVVTAPSPTEVAEDSQNRSNQLEASNAVEAQEQHHEGSPQTEGNTQDENPDMSTSQDVRNRIEETMMSSPVADLGIDYIREDMEEGGPPHSSNHIEVTIRVDNRGDDDMGDDDMADDADEDDDDDDGEDDDEAEDGTGMMSLADTDVEDHDDTGLGDDFNDEMIDEEDDDFHENRVIEVRWREALDGLDHHLQVLGQPGAASGLIDVAAEPFEGVNVDDLYGIRRSLGFERRRQTVRSSFDRSAVETSGFQHPLLLRPNQLAGTLSRDLESMSSEGNDASHIYMFDAPVLTYDHAPSSLFGSRLTSSLPPPLADYSLGLDSLQLPGRRGLGDGRWTDDGQPQAGTQATAIAQAVEEQFLSHLRQNTPAEQQLESSGVQEKQQVDAPNSESQQIVEGDNSGAEQGDGQNEENDNVEENQGSHPSNVNDAIESSPCQEPVNPESTAEVSMSVQPLSLNSTPNRLDNMEIGNGNGSAAGEAETFLEFVISSMEAGGQGGSSVLADVAAQTDEATDHLEIPEDAQAAAAASGHITADVEMNSVDPEDNEVDQSEAVTRTGEADLSLGQDMHTEDAADQPDQMVQEVASGNAIDPTFLEALPEDLRAEVLASQQAQSVQPPAYVPPSAEEIDPEFLAALPPEIQAEVLAQQRAQRATQQLQSAQPVDMDNASIIATFPADLRQEVLMTSSEAVLSALPSQLLAEAQMLRDRAASHYQARTILGGSHRLNNRRSGLGFDRQSAMDRGIGVTIGQRAASTVSDGLKVKEFEGQPLLDAKALKGLIRLLRLAQPLGKGLLQRLLLNLCAHSTTRANLVVLLLSMMKPETESSASGLPSFNSQRLYGCQSNTIFGRSQLLDGIPPLVLRRILEILTYLATNHNAVANLLFYFDSSILSESSSIRYLDSKSYKGKEKVDEGVLADLPRDSVDNVPLVVFLKLLDRPLSTQSTTHFEQVLGLIQVIVYGAAARLESQPRAEQEMVDAQMPPEQPTDVEEIEPSTDHHNSNSDNNKLQDKASTAESSSSAGKTSVNTYDVFLQLPQPELRNLCSLLGREGLSDKVYLLASEVLKKLARVAVPLRKLFILALSELAHDLSGSAVNELVTLRKTHMLGLSAGSMAGAAMLRVLQTLSSLASSIANASSGFDADNEQEQARMWKLYSALESLWQELSDCIGMAEAQLSQSSLSPMSDVNIADHVMGIATSSSSSLPPGTQRLLPYIEAFFVLSEKLQASHSPAQQDNVSIAANEDAGSSSSSATKSGSDSQKKSDGSVTFMRFAEKHRRLLNAFVRQNPGLMENSLSMLLKTPRLVDFDNKRAHFRSRIRQQHEHGLSGPLRISVRRAYVLEDSYNQLRMRSTQELKGRLNVQFQGEEGIDAGGLTREWYQLLSRVIFDRNALLFTTVGNNATFQPNPNSVYQTEHLSYFKFVGRVVAKALFDGQLLDVHFTRSFYKHILGIKVTYHDIEAVDPDYYKNLKWMLENDVSDILDLTFSMDADEEKHILYEKNEVTDFELKPGGRNIRVTEETKHEYVDLVADHILTNAIRTQINSFLEGFSELIPRDLISIFNDKELELLISGLPEIDLDDLKANTEYSGFTAASSVVQWFWEVVKAFNKEDMARLLQFVTGTSKVPLEGFKALQGISGPQRFQIHKAYGAPVRLPSAHTCFNQLDLPEYTSKEQLQERLLLAIHEASEGFGFG